MKAIRERSLRILVYALGLIGLQVIVYLAYWLLAQTTPPPIVGMCVALGAALIRTTNDKKGASRWYLVIRFFIGITSLVIVHLISVALV